MTLFKRFRLILSFTATVFALPLALGVFACRDNDAENRAAQEQFGRKDAGLVTVCATLSEDAGPWTELSFNPSDCGGSHRKLFVHRMQGTIYCESLRPELAGQTLRFTDERISAMTATFMSREGPTGSIIKKTLPISRPDGHYVFSFEIQEKRQVLPVTPRRPDDAPLLPDEITSRSR